MLIDTHAHLDFTDDVDGWVERAKGAGVGKIINVGTSIGGSKKSVEIAEKYSTRDLAINASVGIHPQDGEHDVKKFGSLNDCLGQLKQIAKSSKKVVAIGEIGLDYHREGGQRPDSAKASTGKPVTSGQEKEFQRELFVEQIKLAQELDLPILVHCRNGWEEIFDFLSNVKGQLSNVRGLFHSWTGNWGAAQKALDMGFYISFSGIVTFKNAPLVQEVAKKVPIDRILVETDSPFLSPEPHRGVKNEPKNVIITAQFLAQLRGISLDTIEEMTSENAGRLLGI